VRILIVYLNANSASSIKNNSSITRKIKVFNDKYSCISKLSSTKGRVIYFIISATLAKIIIPLIHNYIHLENIYIHQQDDSINDNFTFTDGFSKIRGTWTSLQEIEEQVERDILSIETRPSNWSRTPDIFRTLWAQNSSTAIMPAISNDIKQSLEVPIIVTLYGIKPIPFCLPKENIETYEFSVVEDCHQFIKVHGPSSIFLNIIDDYKVISDKVQLLVENNSIHALYVFPIKSDSNMHYEAISIRENSKIAGIFYEEKDLLLQMTADIYFFRQISTHTPQISILEIQFDILSKSNPSKIAFLSFQFFIEILQQLWCAVDVPSSISNQIETADIDLSSDLYINNVQLILEIDRLTKQFDPPTLFKASSRLRHINQYHESSMQKLYPFSITIYRAQLISDKDLKAIQDNENNLFAIHTFVLASRSFSSTKSICRRAYDNGLNAVLFEINISKMTPLTYLDPDTIIFPLSTVFRIKSTATAPDKICHVQIELANSTMDLINQKLYFNIGERLSWLTFGNYLAHIKKYDIAEAYFKYLQTIPLKNEESALLYNNMGSMYFSMDGKDDKALNCLQKIEELIELNQAEVSGRKTQQRSVNSLSRTVRKNQLLKESCSIRSFPIREHLQ
jgi:tetratricopeptide (TPR) repeat protein